MFLVPEYISRIELTKMHFSDQDECLHSPKFIQHAARRCDMIRTGNIPGTWQDSFRNATLQLAKGGFPILILEGPTQKSAKHAFLLNDTSEHTTEKWERANVSHIQTYVCMSRSSDVASSPFLFVEVSPSPSKTEIPRCFDV